jgi:hypothetical protein
MGRESAPASVKPASVKRSSASVRYWKARLQVLKRPAVWLSALALLLPLIFLAYYWRNPEGLVAPQASSSTDSFAPSETEDAADLQDETVNSPAVQDASTLIEVPALPEGSGDRQNFDGQATQTLPQPTLLEALLSAPLPGLESPQPKVESRSRNPFVAQPRKREPSQVQALDETSSVLSSPLLSSAFLPPSTATDSGFRSGLNSERTTQAALTLSPLQSALDRSAGIGNGSQPTATSTDSQTNSQLPLTAQALPNSAALPWLTPSGQFARPLGTPPLGAQTYMPQTSPFPGTTGYTMPSALRPAPYSVNYPAGSNGSNSYYGVYPNTYPPFGYSSAPYSTGLPVSPAAPGYSTLPQLQVPIQTLPVTPDGRTPGYSSRVPVPIFNTPATPVVPQSAPFSIPRTPPGRYIGGGEINTFSNP